MDFKDIVVGLAIASVSLQGSSVAVDLVESEPKPRAVVEIPQPSSSPSSTPIPTFTPRPIPSPTPKPTPESTFISEPEIVIIPTPTPIPTFMCSKIHGKSMGKHGGWVKQNRICIGKR